MTAENNNNHANEIMLFQGGEPRYVTISPNLLYLGFGLSWHITFENENGFRGITIDNVDSTQIESVLNRHGYILNPTPQDSIVWRNRHVWRHPDAPIPEY